MQVNQVNDWTVDLSAMIVENEDYVVMLCDDGGGYDVAHIRRKHARLRDGMDRIAGREALIAFDRALRQRRAS